MRAAVDFEACIAHLRFQLRHRRVIRTTSLLERLFLEERRRTKIIPMPSASGRSSS
jgi:putative transposase